MGYSLQHNTPTTGSIQWSGVDIIYDGISYAVGNGTTNKKYSYWLLSSPNVLQTSDAYPSLTAADCLVFVNNGGVGISVLDASVMDGSIIVPGTIQSDALVAGSISSSHIAAHSIIGLNIAANTITGDKLVADTVTADKIDGRNLAIKDENGNVIFGVSKNLDAGRIDGLSGVVADIVPRTMILSNESQMVPADQDGVVTSWLGVSTTIMILGPEGADETPLWTLSKVDYNVTATLTTTTVAASDMPTYVDSGYVTITATRTGYGTLTKRFNITKAKYGTGQTPYVYTVRIESSNGTVFRFGEARQTVLVARVFRNDLEVTDQISASNFRWIRTSLDPQPPPNDDATWNALYYQGYKQVTVSVDDVHAKATFNCEIYTP